MLVSFLLMSLLFLVMLFLMIMIMLLIDTSSSYQYCCFFPVLLAVASILFFCYCVSPPASSPFLGDCNVTCFTLYSLFVILFQQLVVLFLLYNCPNVVYAPARALHPPPPRVVDDGYNS